MVKQWGAVLALCFSLLSAQVGTLREAAIWGDSVDGVSATLARGTVMSSHTYWTAGDVRTENYITLEPGASLRPVAVSQERLCSAAGMKNTAKAWTDKHGGRVVAGINGGFYNMADYSPVGVVIGDGVLRCGDDGLEAVGFRADGSAVFGAPGIALRLNAGEESVTDLDLNAARGASLALYAPGDCASTRAAGGGWHVYCAFDRTVPVSGDVTLTVDRVEYAEGSVNVPRDRMVLRAAGESAPGWLTALEAGQTMKLEVRCAPGWEDVESGLCLLFPLVKNGRVVDGLDGKNEPRTAIGVRADGGLVLYTVDGRRSEHSVGAGLNAVARRMLELGCVTAGALDGGGSTSLQACLPGDAELSQINLPSGGSERAVTNYIFLTTGAPAAGKAAYLALYPLDIDALPGAEIALTVRAVDENGWPAPVPEELSFEVSGGLGSVGNGVFRAAGDGRGSVSVSAPGIAGASIPLTVAETPDELELYGEVYGHLTESLTLDVGQEVDLTARAVANHVSLSASDECFTWSMDPDVASVDRTGHLIPLNAGVGYLTVTAGRASVTIPIRVRGIPFRDVEPDDPRYDAVRYVYENELFAGTSETEFSPDAVMDRAMLVTVLWRMEGRPEAEGTADFLDVDPERWYAPAVAWAAETGVVRGYSDACFGPLDELTREQILTILYRYAREPEAEAASWEAFPDAGEESAWAHDALVWASGERTGLVLPEDGALRPKAPMTRADVAETLMRYLES